MKRLASNSKSTEICLPLLGLKAYTTTPNCMFGFGGRGNVGLLKVGTFYIVILI